MCRATVRADLDQPTVVCTACDARFAPALATDPVLATAAVHALETTPATSLRAWAARVLGLLLCFGFPFGAAALGVSRFWGFVMCLAACVGVVVWDVRQSGRPALPGAAALHRDRARALPPAE